MRHPTRYCLECGQSQPIVEDDAGISCAVCGRLHLAKRSKPVLKEKSTDDARVDRERGAALFAQLRAALS